MPVFDEKLLNGIERERKGDLFIQFNIIFPKYINPDIKDEIIKVLDLNTQI